MVRYDEADYMEEWLFLTCMEEWLLVSGALRRG